MQLAHEFVPQLNVDNDYKQLATWTTHSRYVHLNEWFK